MRPHLSFRLTAVFLLALGLLAGLLYPLTAVSGTVAPPPEPAVIINEWSQGNGGAKEWVEFLVVQGPVDMRGWSLDDSSASGRLTFTGESWTAVPAGTLIVVYNGNDRDTVLPADETDPSTGRLVVPHTDETRFSGGWPAFSNSNVDDVPHLRDAADLTVHNFVENPGDLHPAAREAAAFVEGDLELIVDTAYWMEGRAAETTAGQGNTITNTAWIDDLRGTGPTMGADVRVGKSADSTATAGGRVVYTLTVQNEGALPADNVVLTDRMPTAVQTATAYPPATEQPASSFLLVWEIGRLSAGISRSITVSARLWPTATGTVTNRLTATTTTTDTNPVNNSTTAVTLVQNPEAEEVLIDAVMPDGQVGGDADEAIRLYNVGSLPAEVGGWQLVNGSRTLVLPPDATIAPHTAVWIARDGGAFATQFGRPPDYDTIPGNTISDTAGSWPTLANSGGLLLWRDASEVVVDAVAYGDEAVDDASPDWIGPPVNTYGMNNQAAAEGQILYRKRTPAGARVTDSNRRADWAQDPADFVIGRRILYPGWELERFFVPYAVTETAVLTVAVAPDNAYELLQTHFQAARESILIASLTVENPAVAADLAAAAQRGVSVTMLLEGAEISEQERYVCRELEAAGGACWFMYNDESGTHPNDIFDRYKYQHAKFMVIDGRVAVVGTQNLTNESVPDDDKTDGSWGRRGVLLFTDASGVVAHLQAVFAADLNPARHRDLVRYAPDHARFGPPPNGFVPATAVNGITYTVRYTRPLTVRGEFAFELIQSPENSLNPAHGLFGLLARAGRGDRILVQQLYERPYWGAAAENAPNLRLEAYLDAARRGARVEVMLDGYFDRADEVNSNQATCRYLLQAASSEGLSVRCRTANPTGLGIHSKLVLAHINGRGYVHVGSWNGSEQSAKGNREVVLQVQSDEAYALLARMFQLDGVGRVYLPLFQYRYIGPADYPLISELMPNPFGLDRAEFVEIVNPGRAAFDLSGYSLSDAISPTQFADLRHFPADTILPGRGTLVVAQQATAFMESFGTAPDFEILDTHPDVPELEDNPAWGDPATFLQLGNGGDVILLRHPSGAWVDVVAYGDKSITAETGCAVVSVGQSLRRNPYWRDTDDCPVDFEMWAAPDPGILP